MAKHRQLAERAARRHQQVPRRRRVTAGVLAASAGVALAATAGTGTANAACASIWGIGNTVRCQSTLGNIAIGLDDDGTALAENGFFNFALTQGPGLAAAGLQPLDIGNIAISVGSYGAAQAGGVGGLFPQYGDFGPGIGNIAINAFNGFASNYASAVGLHNTALVLFNNDMGSAFGTQRIATVYGAFNHGAVIGSQSLSDNVLMYSFGSLGLSLLGQGSADETILIVGGYFSDALNLYGSSSQLAGGVLDFTFNALGTNNDVTASPLLGIAGALGASNLTVAQSGPGITINNSALPFARSAAPAVARTAATGSAPDDAGGPVASAVSQVNTAVSQVNTAVSQVNTAVSRARSGDGPLSSAVSRVRAGNGPLSSAVSRARSGDGPVASAVRRARSGDGPLSSAVSRVRAAVGSISGGGAGPAS